MSEKEMIIPTPRTLRLLAGLLLALSLLPACARVDTPLPQAVDLQATGQEAARAGVPVVLAVVADGCPYCRVLEDEILQPMQVAPEYREGVRLRVLNISSSRAVRDFDGLRRSPSEIAARYGIRLTPTVLVLGPNGEELGERQVGISVLDYYWGYLDAAIADAHRRLSAHAGMAPTPP